MWYSNFVNIVLKNRYLPLNEIPNRSKETIRKKKLDIAAILFKKVFFCEKSIQEDAFNLSGSTVMGS